VWEKKAHKKRERGIKKKKKKEINLSTLEIGKVNGGPFHERDDDKIIKKN